MVDHVLSERPYKLLQRLNKVGWTSLFDSASAHLLHRAGLAVWDKEVGQLKLTAYGQTMTTTVRPWSWLVHQQQQG